jgi:uncharacterized phiE125 gp8 family phage protein
MSLITSGRNHLIQRFPIDLNPKTKPVSSDLVKEHILVNHGSDDNLLDVYTWAAVEEVETRGSVALVKQARRQYLGPDIRLEGETLALSVVPVASITGVYYLDADGLPQTLDQAKYRQTQKGVWFGVDLPAMVRGPDKLWVDYVAGFGETSASVPMAWQHCVMFMVMRKYELRGDDIGKNSEQWERAFSSLILCAGGELRGY